MHGCPAKDVSVELWKLEPDSDRRLLKRCKTNDDGRIDTPLLLADEMLTGTYELLFMIVSYFQQLDTALPDPPFLDIVPVRFSIADDQAHYHIPLLVSPWSYSTYRGS